MIQLRTYFDMYTLSQFSWFIMYNMPEYVYSYLSVETFDLYDHFIADRPPKIG